MTHNLPLHGIAVYNPALLDRDELRRYFVARQPMLDALLDDLRRESPDRPPQHRLIIGTRGMGKTTILHRLALAVEEDAELDAVWLPLNFPEEQYNISHLSDLWLNCLDALGDLLERREGLAGAEGLDELVDRLPRDEEPRAREALAALLATAEGMQRRLILLIDNIDIVFERLKAQHWAIREVLGQQPRLLLIGASARMLEETWQYDAAFYDFFRIHELKGLALEEMNRVLTRLAEIEDNPKVRTLVEQDPGRLRTLHTLTGGNPRTTVLLYGVLAQGIDGDVRSDLERLLDHCTPLYKARFEELPAQAQKVVDALAVHWDPTTAGELAEALRLPVNTVSAQLARLADNAVVEKVKLKPGSKTGFQIAERFFNIWYLMRTSRRVRRRLVWLVQFLRVFYTPEELSGHAQRHLRGLRGPKGERASGMRMRQAETGFALDPDNLYASHTFATILTRNGKWPEAEEEIRRLLAQGTEEFFEKIWSDMVTLFAEAAAIGRAGEAAALLKEQGLDEKWRPLHAALVALAEGPQTLARIAPEVRRPAEELMARLKAPRPGME